MLLPFPLKLSLTSWSPAIELVLVFVDLLPIKVLTVLSTRTTSSCDSILPNNSLFATHTALNNTIQDKLFFTHDTVAKVHIELILVWFLDHISGFLGCFDRSRRILCYDNSSLVFPLKLWFSLSRHGVSAISVVRTV
jgi:hypothetical protein